MGTAYDRGLILYRQSRWAMAADEFRAELAVLPGSVMGHAMLGMSHLQLKQYEAAEAEIFEAARLGPDVGYTHYALAYMTLQERASGRARAERFVKAREHLAQAISLEPFNPQNHCLLAELEADAERWVACLAAAERGLEARPSHERCMWFRARSLWSVNRRDEAMDVLKQTLALNPEQAAAHRLLGWILVQQNQFASAFEHLEQSLRLDPRDDGAQNLWRQANVRRFPRIGRLWWNDKPNIKALLNFYCYVLAVVTAVHVFSGDIHNSARPLLCVGDVLMALAAARTVRRLKTVSSRRLDYDQLLFETMMLLLFGAWLAVGMAALLGYQELAEQGLLTPLDLALVVWMPAVPLFLIDYLGVAWMRHAMGLVQSNNGRIPEAPDVHPGLRNAETPSRDDCGDSPGR